MNYSSFHMNGKPILIVPYMWIGDFVRCHTVVRLLLQRQPGCAIDVLTTPTVAPLLDYMPGVRKAIVADLPRKRLAWKAHAGLAKRLRAEGYGQALVMRTPVPRRRFSAGGRIRAGRGRTFQTMAGRIFCRSSKPPRRRRLRRLDPGWAKREGHRYRYMPSRARAHP